MESRTLARGLGAMGGISVITATLLPWGSPNPVGGFPFGSHVTVVGVNINNTAPFVGPYIGDSLRGGPISQMADAWHVATPSALALIATALVTAWALLAPGRRMGRAGVVAVLAVLAVSALTVLTWIHPPGFSLGPLGMHRSGAGEPVALAGAAMLLGGLAVRLIAGRTGG